MPLFADVLLPLPLPPLTFDAGEFGPELAAGSAAAVRLGARKICTGIVWRLHDTPPKSGAAKPVMGLVTAVPPLDEHQMRLWEWLAEYYMTPLGLVMKSALAAPLKASGFSQEEFERNTFRPPAVRMIDLACGDSDTLHSLFESLGRARAQYAALVRLVELLPADELFSAAVPLVALGADGVIVRKLIERGAVRVFEEEIVGGQPFGVVRRVELTVPQQLARDMLDAAQQPVTLYRGSAAAPVIDLIASCLERGEDVLLMTPEIAPRSPLVEQLEELFGERAVVYRQELTDRRKGEIYRALASAPGRLAIGTRGAMFLPFRKLSLVVVEREHEGLYKSEYAPHFNYRDSATMLASIHGARAILWSPTPSVESWFNAVSGRYALVEAQEEAPPRIVVSDTLRAVKRGERRGHFNLALLDAMDRALDGQGQVVLFQNRRGFATMVECEACGWGPRCGHCNVHTTLHRGENVYKCHYCGATAPAAVRCPDCSAPLDNPKGFGTEKIEASVRERYPSARVARLDSDVATSAAVMRRVVADFHAGAVDLLVGTQLIAREFYSRPVALGAILNADNMLGVPDFRASERAFQTVSFFASHCDELIVQTSQPDNPVLRFLAAGDYRSMAAEQLAERRQFFYPPYCRLIRISLAHRESRRLWDAAARFHSLASPVFGVALSEVIQPVVERVKGRFVVEFLLRTVRTESFRQAKNRLSDVMSLLRGEFRDISATINVDPQ
ncbi:MAG: primosomal protein N' [Rikenellaceae bacterium]|jgi:primosomal protein N' (replication factor Y)|nr:primosomal protein N' [Rikenellaceae bacterium]